MNTQCLPVERGDGDASSGREGVANKQRVRFSGEWELTRVSDFGEVVTGGTPPTGIDAYWRGPYPWITPSDISSGRDMTRSERMISREGLAAIRRLPAGSVLVTCIASIGKNAILRTDGGCNQQINAIIPKTAHNAEFVYYLFESNAQYLLTKAGTTATSIVSKKTFSELRFYTPTVEEQRAIAAVLSDVDSLIGSLEALIAKKQAIKRAAMQQLLTSRTRLPGFEGEWERVSLGRIARTYGGLAGKTKADFGDGTARYVSFLDVLENVVLTRQRFDRVRVSPSESQNPVGAGDVLFNATSETPEDLAMGSVVDFDSTDSLYLNSFCFGVRIVAPERCDPLFLAYLSRGAPGRRLMYALAQGATRYNLSTRRFLGLRFPLPPLPEQRAIATVLSDMDAEIAALARRLAKIRALKQGMMQQLLTGTIRLPIPDAVTEDEPGR